MSIEVLHPSANLILEGSMSIMIGFKASEQFRRFLQSMAKKENRSVSNFIVNAILVYLREHHNVEWDQEDHSPTSRGKAP